MRTERPAVGTEQPFVQHALNLERGQTPRAGAMHPNRKRPMPTVKVDRQGPRQFLKRDRDRIDSGSPDASNGAVQSIQRPTNRGEGPASRDNVGTETRQAEFQIRPCQVVNVQIAEYLANPRATTTSPRIVDVIVHALSDVIDLDVVFTAHREHAMAVGEGALESGLDVVATLGGDGVINEVVNGILRDGPGPHVPLLATVPGGSGNVFARSLGIPLDPIEATGMLLELIRARTVRTIGLGRADERWFVANAGLGIDAEIIAAMERQRRDGRSATPLRYLATTLDQYFRRTNRRDPELSLRRGDDEVDGAFLAFVQNTGPWTYLGSKPINPCPEASFDTGLDVFAKEPTTESPLFELDSVVVGFWVDMDCGPADAGNYYADENAKTVR